METPGNRILSLRTKLGLSQQQFAELVNAGSKATVNNWEKDRNFPNKDQLIKISEVSGKQIDWILKGSLNEIKTRQQTEYKIEATIPAGISEIKDTSDWAEYEDLAFDPREHFYLKVDEEFGYSMMPLVNPGDLVLVSFSAKVKDGDLVAARWDKTKGALKVYKEKKKNVVLLSYNQAVEPIFLSRDEVEVYKVVLIKKKK